MNFNDTLGSSFGALEFLRPYWLLGLLVVIVFSLLRYQRSKYKQTNIIAEHLSEHLVTLPETSKNNRLALSSLAVIACIALSGPSIRSVDIPVFEMQKAQIIALDLSYSMYATDAKPNRLSQAKYKTIDLLKQWTEGEKALIAYAGDAFTISPLTLDSNAIINHIPHLSPDLMPARGSRPDLALQKAISLLENSGYQQGHIVFITDGFDQDSLDTMQAIIKGSKWMVSVLAMATPSGAPITLTDGSLLKDNAGQIVIPRLEGDILYPITRSSDGLYLTFDAKGQDIKLLSNHYESQNERKENNAQQQAENKQLIDDGYWISFLLLPLFLLLFRKGVFYVALLAVTLPLSTPKVEASIWQNNQQNAHQAFESGDYKEASETFKDPAWKASALFKNKQYKQAEAVYSDQIKAEPNNADALYNLGNTQAMQENYEQALASYEEALAINPNHQQAQNNKQTVGRLLKQKEQQKQQKNEQQSPDDQEQSDKDNEQSSDEQQSQEQQDDQQSSDEQKSQQQQDDQQSSDEQQSQQSSEQEQSEQQSSEQKQKESQEASDEQSEQRLTEQKENEDIKNEDSESMAQQSEESTSEENEQAVDQQALSELGQPENEEYEALPNWLKNMPDDPSLLLRNKMRLEYRKRSSNKPVLQKNNGEIW